ncbi:hypothetical protein ACJ73_09200 [Blastomyces percursus]|uniref:Uncharacterized protein n=1 Tax=Blastomyces percursus TaxID=1658174 RepID=A0A1J9PBY6_9EURO|nr:hypothetical protein ACJ73_09200 [Blastomyces percursus]
MLTGLASAEEALRRHRRRPPPESTNNRSVLTPRNIASTQHDNGYNPPLPWAVRNMDGTYLTPTTTESTKDPTDSKIPTRPPQSQSRLVSVPILRAVKDSEPTPTSYRGQILRYPGTQVPKYPGTTGA